MANGNNQVTWQTIADKMDEDEEIKSAMLEVSRAAEVGPRAPCLIMLRLHKDVGKAALDLLPEPDSKQETRVDGLGYRIGENDATMRDGNPTRYWDHYYYPAKTGETLQGSVYKDMIFRTAAGKMYLEYIKNIQAHSSQDVKKENLVKIIRVDGQDYDLSTMHGPERKNLELMLNSRILRMSANLRRAVALHRQIQDIETRMPEAVQVRFVWNERDKPESGLAKVTKPVMLLELNRNKDSADYGQRTGFMETFASTVFISLSVDKAIAAGGSYTALKDSRKERFAKGAGASTKDKDKAVVEGRVSSNNLLTVMSNIRVFAEDEDSKKRTFDRLSAMKADDRAELVASILYYRDWSADFDTPANRELARQYTGTKTEKAKADAEAKAKADAERAELDKQPTQHERNAAEKAALDAAEAARAAAAEKVEPQQTTTTRRRKVT